MCYFFYLRFLFFNCVFFFLFAFSFLFVFEPSGPPYITQSSISLLAGLWCGFCFIYEYMKKYVNQSQFVFGLRKDDDSLMNFIEMISFSCVFRFLLLSALVLFKFSHELRLFKSSDVPLSLHQMVDAAERCRHAWSDVSLEQQDDMAGSLSTSEFPSCFEPHYGSEIKCCTGPQMIPARK